MRKLLEFKGMMVYNNNNSIKTGKWGETE